MYFMPNLSNFQRTVNFSSYRKILIFLTISFIISSFNAAFLLASLENEKTAVTITDIDFQALVSQREKGSVGFHKNVDPNPMIPAPESAVLNWSELSTSKRSHLINKQKEMFSQGKNFYDCHGRRRGNTIWPS